MASGRARLRTEEAESGTARRRPGTTDVIAMTARRTADAVVEDAEGRVRHTRDATSGRHRDTAAADPVLDPLIAVVETARPYLTAATHLADAKTATADRPEGNTLDHLRSRVGATVEIEEISLNHPIAGEVLVHQHPKDGLPRDHPDDARTVPADGVRTLELHLLETLRTESSKTVPEMVITMPMRLWKWEIWTRCRTEARKWEKGPRRKRKWNRWVTTIRNNRVRVPQILFPFSTLPGGLGVNITMRIVASSMLVYVFVCSTLDRVMSRKIGDTRIPVSYPFPSALILSI